jgi:hypothetical protein
VGNGNLPGRTFRRQGAIRSACRAKSSNQCWIRQACRRTISATRQASCCGRLSGTRAVNIDFSKPIYENGGARALLRRSNHSHSPQWSETTCIDVVSSRPVSAKSGRSPTSRPTGQFDPLLPSAWPHERAESARKRSSVEGVGRIKSGPRRRRPVRRRFRSCQSLRHGRSLSLEKDGPSRGESQENVRRSP